METKTTKILVKRDELSPFKRKTLVKKLYLIYGWKKKKHLYNEYKI